MKPNVSSAATQARVVKLGLRMLSAVSPDAAERTAAALFMRPRRRDTRPPEIDGQVATSFAIAQGENDLQCWSWGEGPTVLLVHGWEGHSGQLARFIPPLLAAGHRVVAFDLPAHGHSSGRVAHLVMAADAILGVAKVCGPVRGVIAHSFGAAATARALLLGLKAERVVLIGAPAEPSIFVRRAAQTFGLSEASTEGVLDHLTRSVGVTMEALDLRVHAAKINTPALIIHDREDEEVPWAHAEATARAWPQSRLLETQGLGHRRILKDPETIAEVVTFVGTPPV